MSKIQYRSLAVFLLFLCLGKAQAQNDVEVFRSIEKCKTHVVGYNIKYELSMSEYFYCDSSESNRIKINANPTALAKCINKVKALTSNISDLLDLCLPDNIRNAVNDPKFAPCVNITKPSSMFFKENFDYCANKENREFVSGEIFSFCMANHKYAFAWSSEYMALNFCLKRKEAMTFSSPEFSSCRKELMVIGLSDSDASKHCIVAENQKPEKISKLIVCANKIKEVVGTPIIELCIEDKYSSYPRPPTESELKCLETNRKTYLDRTFFLDEDSTDRKKLIKDMMSGCENKPILPINPEKFSSLKFAGVKIVNRKKLVESTKVGGLSGLAFDSQTNVLMAVSDDPGYNSPSRLYNIALDFTGQMALDFASHTVIKTKHMVDSTKDTKVHNIDAEGIALLPGNLMAISSETQIPKSESYLRLYKRDGAFVSEIALPTKFIPLNEVKKITDTWTETFWEDIPEETKDESDETQDDPPRPRKKEESKPPKQRRVERQRTSYTYKTEQVAGVFSNNAFEALVSVPGKDILYTSNESPLFQDTLLKERIVRIVKLVRDEKSFLAKGEFLYPLENKEGNGLVDMVAMDENRLFVLERRFSNNSQKVTAQIFEVDLNGADDYSLVQSLSEEMKKNPLKTLKKKLLLNLNEILPFLPESFKRIDNLEGMSLGPKLPNGNQSLILVSDNNFSMQQMTQFIILEIAQ